MKRSFLGVVGAALLLVFGMPGWAVAQTELPEATAIAIEDNTQSTDITEVAPKVEGVAPTYNAAKVTWSIAPAYAANCGMGTGETAVDCEDNRTPLTGFVVYYSSQRSDFTPANAEGEKDVTAPGRNTPTPSVASTTIEDLKPNRTYYFLVAAENSVGIGPPVDVTPVLSTKTAMAPVPEQVARVEVTPGDMMLTVSWDEPRPDESANRTNHVIEKYHVQYRTSQTVSNQPGDWMPTPDGMEVSGTMTEAEITGLTNGTPYDVQVRAVNDATGVGDYSAQSSTTTGTPMAGTGGTPPTTPPPTTPPPTTPPPTTSGAPTGKPAVEVEWNDSGDVTVSWTDVEGATKYMVEWKTAAQTFGNPDRQAEVTGATMYEIDGYDLEMGKEYMFRVTAGNAAGYGPPSAEATATPERKPDISRPTNLRLEVGDMMIMASWGKPERGADLVKGYKAWTQSAGGVESDKVDVGMNYEVTFEGLTNGVEYDVIVCPYDGDDVRYSFCARSDAVTPMGVPALPIFGAVALGAGLLAAGRARLRRRELRAGRVQRQINR